MKTNSKGLNSFGLLIVVFAIGLVGASAWAYYSRQNSTSDDTTAEQSVEIEPQDETVNWKTEAIDNFGIHSFKYPAEDGWDISKGVVDSLSPGHEATVSVNYTKCGPNCGFALSIGLFDKKFEAGTQKNFAEKHMQDNAYYRLTSKQAVTVDGVTGTRWQYTPEDDAAAVIVYYYFTQGDFSYTLVVNNNGAKTEAVDITGMGEKIVGTLQFTE